METTHLDDISDLFPLIGSWITASWVVSACVENDDSTFWSVRQVFQESFQINATGLWVPVTVRSQIGITGMFKQLMMVLPGWVGVVNHVAVEVTLQEFSSKTQSSGS